MHREHPGNKFKRPINFYLTYYIVIFVLTVSLGYKYFFPVDPATIKPVTATAFWFSCVMLFVCTIVILIELAIPKRRRKLFKKRD